MKLDDAEAKQRIEDFLGKEKADELFEKMLDKRPSFRYYSGALRATARSTEN